MIDTNKLHVIETDGSIHEMIFVGDYDWEERATTSLQEIRNKAIDEFIKRLYKIGEQREFDWEDIYKIADEMKGE